MSLCCILVSYHDLEQRLGTKLNDIYSFKNSSINTKEMNTYSKDKTHKSKKR